jgi:hypothetical protein
LHLAHRTQAALYALRHKVSILDNPDSTDSRSAH